MIIRFSLHSENLSFEENYFNDQFTSTQILLKFNTSFSTATQKIHTIDLSRCFLVNISIALPWTKVGDLCNTKIHYLVADSSSELFS